MSRLLAANLLRLKKSILFRMEMILMVVLGIYVAVVSYISIKEDGVSISLDNGFFHCAIVILILAAALCSLYLGTEYSDGTLRNKVVIGRRRSSVYLANLITCALACIILCALYFAASLCAGLPLLGPFERDPRQIAVYVLCTFLLALTLSALFTLAAMLIQNKAVTVAVCLLGSFFLLLSGIYMDSRLHEPETYPAYSLTVNGEVLPQDDIPNPYYLRGNTRKVYEFLLDFLPGGQAIQIDTKTAAHPERLPLYAVIITVLTTGCGIYLFNRKDLR